MEAAAHPAGCPGKGGFNLLNGGTLDGSVKHRPAVFSLKIKVVSKTIRRKP
jgi:hypothetical protein